MFRFNVWVRPASPEKEASKSDPVVLVPLAREITFTDTSYPVRRDDLLSAIGNAGVADWLGINIAELRNRPEIIFLPLEMCILVSSGR